MKAFCNAPFVQLSMRHDGKINPCCFRRDYFLKNEKKSPIKSAWLSSELSELQKRSLAGGDAVCRKLNRIHGCREYFRSWDDKVDFAIEQSGPRKLDIRFSGRCNLKCKMCDVWKSEDSFYVDKKTGEFLEGSLLPFVEEIDLVGGEPFFQKEVWQFLKYLNTNFPTISIGLVTNGQWNLSSRQIELLKNIPIRFINVSVDSTIPDTYSKIRVGGDYIKLLKAIQQLKEIREANPFVLNATQLLQLDNFDQVNEFIDFCTSHKINPIWQLLEKPHQFSLHSIPFKEAVLTKLKAEGNYLRYKGLQAIIAELDSRASNGAAKFEGDLL